MANYTIGGIGFVINVTSVDQVKIVPVHQDIVNRFDEHGDLTSLDRLPEESNPDFRDRVVDQSVHRGGPTYDGLVNNLSRTLGCPRYHAITIYPKEGSEGGYLGANPRVDILADRVVLYSDWQDWQTYTLDKEINFYDQGSDGYYLYQLINEINSSSCFYAVVETDVRTNLHSVNLIRRTSFGRILAEALETSHQHLFEHNHIVTGSIWFEERDIFQKEVVIEPVAKGEYRMDYTNGYVVSYDAPRGENICGYSFNDFPMKVDVSLVRIYSLQDEDFTKKLFHQQPTGAGDTNALPNKEGAEIYHQLFKETNVFWGK